MPILKLRQRELANGPTPILTIRRILKSTGFNLNKNIERQDDFFSDTVTFKQEDIVYDIQEPCIA